MMRIASRFLRTALTSALLCIVLAVTASAAYGSGVVTENSLRLRQQASTSSAILNTVNKGTKVVVLENQKNGWYKVDLNGTVGYMSASYLSVTPTPTTYTGKLDTNGSSLNMRSGPGTNYSRVASIPYGTILTITDSQDGWYKTSYKGTVGYVSGDYVIVTPTETDESSAQEPPADPEPETPAQPEPEPETPAQPEPETPAPSTSGTGKVDTGDSYLNMRSGPGTSYSRVTSIPSGTTLTITDTQNGWYKTSYKGLTGYVSSSFVIFTPGSASSEIPSTQTPETPPTNTGSSSDTPLGEQVVAFAKNFIGYDYVYGANGPSSYDCSSFTQMVYKNFGFSLNRSAAAQYENGTAIELSQVQPGDLLLWRSYGSSKAATHVGIYVGNDMYIHASSYYGHITLSNISFGSSSRYLVGVRRIIE